MEGLTTAEAAKLGGVNVETIRYYERHGLVPKPPRTRSGYRIFSEDSVKRLRFMPGGSCADVRSKTQAKIADVDEKINHLQEIRKALVQLTNTCSGLGPV